MDEGGKIVFSKFAKNSPRRPHARHSWDNVTPVTLPVIEVTL